HDLVRLALVTGARLDELCSLKTSDGQKRQDGWWIVVRAGSAQSMAKRHLTLISPATVNRTVTPKRPSNSKLRTREYLTETEVERLMNAARKNRWGRRDATMTLVAYRHGLRASELTDLRWDQVDFRTGTLHVRRVKQGTPSTHPILG